MRLRAVVLVLGTASLLAAPVFASIGCGAGASHDTGPGDDGGGSGLVDPATLCPAACEFLLRCSGGSGPTFEQCVASCVGVEQLADPCEREQGVDCVRCFAEATACDELDSCAGVACNEQRCAPACGGCAAGELCECESSDVCECVAQ